MPEKLEQAADELIRLYDVTQPPVPIEDILQRPHNEMWERVDVTRMSGTFLDFSHPYAPRMSLGRLLARQLRESEWGKQHQLAELLPDEDSLRRFGRMLMMPRYLMEGLSGSANNATAVGMAFEVPEDDARQRLREME